MEIKNKESALNFASKVILNIYAFDLGNVTRKYGTKLMDVNMLDIFQPFEILDG